jgi:hypothetical protein
MYADDLEDVVGTCLSLDKSGEHIREEGTLIHSRSRTGLAEVRVVHPKPLLQRRVDVIHEDACDVDWVFFKVIE